MEQEASLSFSELTRRLNAMPEFDAETPASKRRTKIGFVVMILSFCAAFLTPRLPISTPAQLVLLCVMLAAEIGGVVVIAWNSRSDFYDLREPLNNVARQLDHDLPHHFELLDWLARQPLILLERHASLARFRRERFVQKLPLIAGSIPTLGLIPVVVAIYLQAREYAAGRHLNWIDFLAGFALAMMYLLSWIAALTKARIEVIDMYLQGALEQKRMSSVSFDQPPRCAPCNCCAPLDRDQ